MRLDKRDRGSLVLWAADCAEHVLPYFEGSTPKTTDLAMPSKQGVGGSVVRSRRARLAPPHLPPMLPPATPMEVRPALPLTPPRPSTLALTPRTPPTTP